MLHVITKVGRLLHKTKSGASTAENALSLSGPFGAAGAAYFGALGWFAKLLRIGLIAADRVVTGKGITNENWTKDYEKERLYGLLNRPIEWLSRLSEKSFRHSLEIYTPNLPNNAVETLQGYSGSNLPCLEESERENPNNAKIRHILKEEEAAKDPGKWRKYVAEEAERISKGTGRSP